MEKLDPQPMYAITPSGKVDAEETGMTVASTVVKVNAIPFKPATVVAISTVPANAIVYVTELPVLLSEDVPLAIDYEFMAPAQDTEVLGVFSPDKTRTSPDSRMQGLTWRAAAEAVTDSSTLLRTHAFASLNTHAGSARKVPAGVWHKMEVRLWSNGA